MNSIKTLSPSISMYAVVFILLISLFMGGIGYWGLVQLDDAQERVRQSNYRAATLELNFAIGRMIELGRDMGQLLSEWDETRQQLGNPTFYAYWRQHRLQHADFLSRFVEDAEVYNPKGKALGSIQLSSMPYQIPEQYGLPWLMLREGVYDLFVYNEVLDEKLKVIGYVGVRIAFLDALKSFEGFRYINKSSLILQGEDLPRQLPPSQINSHLSFRLLENPETGIAHRLMSDAVYKIMAAVVLLSVGFYISLVFVLGLPLRRLSQHIDSLRNDEAQELADWHYALPVAELEKVRLSLHDYQRRLSQVHADLDLKNQELWEQAHRDVLTGVYNRRAFDDDWQRLCTEARRCKFSMTAIHLDCDHFKAVNDTYGHQVGDQVIQVIANSVQKALRQGDKLYRLGGDEFATMLSDSGLEDAVRVAERCSQAIRRFDFTQLSIREPISISIGVAHTDRLDGDELEDLHWQADAAMYVAKRPNAPKVMVYRHELIPGNSHWHASQVAKIIHEVIASGEGLEMYYQPIKAIGAGQQSFVEALARVRHQSEMIPPDSFMPLVALRRLESAFDFAVLRSIEADAAAGLLDGMGGVSINLSAQALMHEDIQQELRRLSPYMSKLQFTLEVTETALITRFDATIEVLDELRKRGFRIALDDFGSGYSSLRYLTHMPVDLVKFDITMTQSLLGSERQRGLMEDMVRLVMKTGYQVVAEGVESEALQREVERLGFHYVQGFLHGRAERPELRSEPG